MNFSGAAIQPHPPAVLGSKLHLKGNEEPGLGTFPTSTAKPGELSVVSRRFAKAVLKTNNLYLKNTAILTFFYQTEYHLSLLLQVNRESWFMFLSDVRCN